MSDQDNLRDRIEQIIEDKTYAMALDGFIAGTQEAAQAIIDELHLFAEVDEDWGEMVIEGWWEKQ